MQLSKLENKAYEELERNRVSVFQIKDLCSLLAIDRQKAYNLIKALRRKKAITKHGSFFALRGTNDLAIGHAIHFPSYLSFWSALNYYGFSDQLPKKIFYATTTYSHDIGCFTYVTLARYRFFGYTRIGELSMAEKEKAIVDSLLLPKYAGGIREIMACVRAAKDQIDTKKLVDYAHRMRSKAVLRRLGFIMEKLGYPHPLLDKLRKDIGKGYEPLDPSLSGGHINKMWLLTHDYS